MPILSSFGKRLWNSFRHLWEGNDPPSRRMERRQFPRFALSLDTPIEILAETPETVPAQIRNISHGGISLALKKQIEPGCLIHVTLPRNHRTTFQILACVRHAVPETADSWNIGCSFIRELETDDLDRLF